MGVIKKLFHVYDDGYIDDSIYHLGRFQVGFSRKAKKGKVIYLPCQRNISNKKDMKEMLESLISSLITYKTKTRTSLPDWFKTPLFDKEVQLVNEIADLDSKRKILQDEIETYSAVKSLLFSSEYELEDKVPKFLKSELGIETKREERFKEDFWILNNNAEQTAICEVKSTVKGFKKSFIYDAFNHRESAELDESFPAILFASFNLNATSWKEKNKPIAKEECNIAVKNNILIVRIEDLIFMWYAFKNNLVTSEKLMNIFISNNGWLHFREDGTYKIEKGN